MPAGAIPKDGPSAGVTMATAICSLVTRTPVSREVAMTGEITLTGQVLPIGGLKEKTLAAQRAGITTVILPSRNEADLEDVPEELRKGMRFVPVDRVEQVWEAAMGLKLDGKSAELAEARELLEEAGELLQRVRGKAGDRRAADNGSAPAKKPAARRRAARAAVSKAGSKAAKPQAGCQAGRQEAGVQDRRLRSTLKHRRRPRPRAAPRRPPPPVAVVGAPSRPRTG